MANKIHLGARPKTFKPVDVQLILPDGSEAVIPVTFIYRTKKEFGKWMDESIAKTKSVVKETPDEFSWEKFYEQNTDAAVEQLLLAVESWGLDGPVSRDALAQLGDETPAAVTAMLGAYGAACREGRLGN